MKTLCTALIVITVLLITHVLPAQANELSLSRFRVFLNDGQRLEGKNGTLTADEMIGVSSDGGQLRIPRSSIRALDRLTGTKAKTGAMIGASMGFLAVLFAYIQVEVDPEREINEAAVAPMFLGFSLGGGLIGMAVGSASKTWERVHVDAELGCRPGRDNTYVTLVFSF